MTIKKTSSKANEISYEILEECGVISERKGGYVLKLRYMSWNGNDPKYDLRPWKQNEDGSETASKGISLTGEELEELTNILNS